MCRKQSGKILVRLRIPDIQQIALLKPELGKDGGNFTIVRPMELGTVAFVDNRYLFAQCRPVIFRNLRCGVLAHRDNGCSFSEGAPHENLVHATLQKRCTAGKAMKNEIVDGCDKRHGTEKRNVEVRRKVEVDSGHLDRVTKFTVLGNGVMRCGHGLQLPGSGGEARNPFSCLRVIVNKQHPRELPLSRKKRTDNLPGVRAQTRLAGSKPTIDTDKRHIRHYHTHVTIDEACKTSGIDRLEAEVLLADLLGKDRTWLLAHGSEDLGKHADQALQRFKERKTGKPVAYITGKKDFCGRSFTVQPGVLIPRESTENLLSLTWDVLHGSTGDCIRTLDQGIVGVARIFRPLLKPEILVDVGTGSGCIGITLALETTLPVIATDISTDAITIAKQNATQLGAELTFMHGDCLDPLSNMKKPFLVVSNPPYIPDGTRLPADVAEFEPHSALFGGKDGNDVLRKILNQAEAHPYCIGVVLECGEKQAALCFPSEP